MRTPKMPPKHVVLALALLVAACGKDSTLHQWIDPDKTFAALPGPQVDTVDATLAKQAADALGHGDNTRAAEFYQQLIADGKASPSELVTYKIGFAEAMRRMGQNDKALAAYDAVLKDQPDNLDAKEGHALTLMAEGKTADAGREFSDILKVDGTRWRTLNALGILFVTKDMIPEAMQYYAEALKHSPDNPAVMNNVGLSQAVDHNFPRAIEALEQASRIASPEGGRRKEIDLNLAMVYGISGNYDMARQVAGRYLEGPALENNLGFYAHLAKDDALAKTYLNMALSHSPTYYERAWDNLDLINGEKPSEDNPVMKQGN